MIETILSKIDKKQFMLYAKRTLLGFVVILFGIYVGNVLFGKSSLEVLWSLKTDKERLELRIDELKKENADLQKKLFELQQLDPDTRKE
ncbi:MAG: septum formation initiator [Campylobacteraceae bacterium]|jgi:cell division protein FtsB|nr:septum formation initiator [Campylobacteraceae bacterium]